MADVPRPRVHRSARRAAHRTVPPALALALLVALTGCLFPPVEELPDEVDHPDPSPGTGGGEQPTVPIGHRSVRQNGSFQDAGQIEHAATVGEQRVATERHTHELPMMVVGLSLRFDWDAETGQDLDLALQIQRDGVAVWNHTVDGGRTGFPDAPVELSFPDLQDEVAYAAPSLLVIDVSAEVTVSTLYEYAGTYTYYERTTG